jgi:hypothetical protein
MWGEGVMKYVDGSRYEGSFVNGKREGFGKYTWNKKKYYEGEWKQGKQDGKGFFFNKGKGIHAIWKDGNILNQLSNDNRTTTYNTSFNNSISNINNRSRVLSTNTNYNDSVLSLNQSNNSGIDKIFFRMKANQIKYKNVDYKLNDITKKRTYDLSKNNKYNKFKKKYVNSNEKDKEKNSERNTIKKSETKTIKNSENKNGNKTPQLSNNSFMINREKTSIKIKSEMQKLNQTQDNVPSKRFKKSYKKK